MITIHNYTKDTEGLAVSTKQLRAYAECYDGDETIYTIDALGMTGYDNCIEWLNLDKDKQNLAEAVAEQTGGNYFNNLTDLLAEWDDIGWLVVDKSITCDYELARHLMYDRGSDKDLLYSILGCSKEAYEQLGNYVDIDSLASTIDIEQNVSYVDGKAYLFFN